MGSSMRVFLVFLLLASIVATGTQADVSPCDTVWGNLNPCGLYISNQTQGDLLDTCCEGLTSLTEEAKPPQDPQSICYCVKSYLAKVPSQNLNIYALFPFLCGVPLPYRLDLTPDCNSTSSSP